MTTLSRAVTHRRSPLYCCASAHCDICMHASLLLAPHASVVRLVGMRPTAAAGLRPPADWPCWRRRDAATPLARHSSYTLRPLLPIDARASARESRSVRHIWRHYADTSSTMSGLGGERGATAASVAAAGQSAADAAAGRAQRVRQREAARAAQEQATASRAADEAAAAAGDDMGEDEQAADEGAASAAAFRAQLPPVTLQQRQLRSQLSWPTRRSTSHSWRRV